MAVALGLAAASANASDAPPALIVVDGSGSMWGKMEGDTAAKFYAVRDGLRALLAATPAQSRVGLASFGHRRKGDCSDVELIAPAEAGGATRVTEALEQLNPKGKGPIALALRESAKSLGTGTLVLIHDNTDNCQQDVCQTAADIAQSNPKLIIHTIGLGLEKADTARMKCIAEQTGGQQFTVSDEAGITTSLEDVFRRAALDPGSSSAPAAATAPAAPAAAPQGPPGLRLTASLSDGGAMLQAPMAWRIAQAGSAADTAPLVERKSAEINEALPAGRYAVTVSHGLVTRTVELDVTDTGPTIHRVNLDAGTVDVTAAASKLGDKLTAPVATLTPKSGDGATAAAPLWIGRDAAVQKIVPAGRYDVTVADGLARSATSLDVAPGASAKAALVLETGRLELSAASYEGGPPADGVTFMLSVDDADAPQGRREIARSAAPTAQFTLQAGTYYVTARVAANEVRERVAISSGDIVKRTLTLNVAKVTVKPSVVGATMPEGLAMITRIWQASGEPRLVAHSTDPEPAFVLGAGKYKLETQAGALNVRATQLFELVAGRDQVISPKLEAGEIAIAAEPGTALRAAIRDTKGRTVWRSRQGAVLKAVVAPGDYMVSLDKGSEEVLRPVSVKLGETYSVGLAAP